MNSLDSSAAKVKKNLEPPAKKVQKNRSKAYSRFMARALADKEKVFLPKNPVFETVKQFLFYALNTVQAVKEYAAVSADLDEKAQKKFLSAIQGYFVDGVNCKCEKRVDVESGYEKPVLVAHFLSSKYRVDLECDFDELRPFFDFRKSQVIYLEKVALYFLQTIAGRGREFENYFAFDVSRRGAVSFCSENENRNLSAALKAVAHLLSKIKVFAFKSKCKKGRREFAAVEFDGALIKLSKTQRARGVLFGVDKGLHSIFCEFKRVAIPHGVFSLPPALMRIILSFIFKIHGAKKMKFSRFSIMNCLQGAFWGLTARKNRHLGRQFETLRGVLECAQRLTDYDFEFESPQNLKRKKQKARNAIADLMQGGNILIKKRVNADKGVNAVAVLVADNAAARAAVDDSKAIGIVDLRESTVKEIVGRSHSMLFYYECGRGLDGNGVAVLDNAQFLRKLQGGNAPPLRSQIVSALLRKIKEWVDRGVDRGFLDFLAKGVQSGAI